MNLEQLLRKPAPKPRELSVCGSGALLDMQQEHYELGWKEGIAAYRKMLRELGKAID